MAYAARPHLHYLPAYRKDAGGPSANIEARSDPDDLLRAREAANIQRGIIIFLEIKIQTFMGVIMQPCYANKKLTDFCQPIATTIQQASQVLDPKYRSLEDWRKRSHTVLEIATTFVLGIAEAHRNPDRVLPRYSDVIQAALEHICVKPD
ncbi:hypothetical protein PDIDSM_3648 [Penicillium digitatum]|nr:hypothetical protein PDIDSM_3648 [Penicillium digitatum]